MEQTVVALTQETKWCGHCTGQTSQEAIEIAVRQATYPGELLTLYRRNLYAFLTLRLEYFILLPRCGHST